MTDAGWDGMGPITPLAQLTKILWIYMAKSKSAAQFKIQQSLENYRPQISTLITAVNNW